MRERGLKQMNLFCLRQRKVVAPYAGAWIETVIRLPITLATHVAPYAGAWIETPFAGLVSVGRIVAPYAGAWIETL